MFAHAIRAGAPIAFAVFLGPMEGAATASVARFHLRSIRRVSSPGFHRARYPQDMSAWGSARRRWLRMMLYGAAAVFLCIAATGGFLAIRFQPIARQYFLSALHNRYRSDIELGDLRISLYPTVRASGDNLVFWFNGRHDLPPLVQSGDLPSTPDSLTFFALRNASTGSFWKVCRSTFPAHRRAVNHESHSRRRAGIQPLRCDRVRPGRSCRRPRHARNCPPRPG